MPINNVDLEALDKELNEKYKDIIEDDIEDDVEEIEDGEDAIEDDEELEEESQESDDDEADEDQPTGDEEFSTDSPKSLTKQQIKDAAAFKKMREEQSKLKAELEAKEAKIKELEMLSKTAGFQGTDDLMAKWKKQQLEKEAQTRGIPAEILIKMQEQEERLARLEKEKIELENQNKNAVVVQQFDNVVSELKLTQEEADVLVSNMGEDGVTLEQLLTLPPKAIEKAIRGYATPIIVERERQSLIKKSVKKQTFKEDKIKGTGGSGSKRKDPFSKEALEAEIAQLRKLQYPHLK